MRRDREIDKDVEADDPRRWRDDGKRDERVAARREREYHDRLRDRDRLPREEGWEPSNDRHGGRWTVVEERDARSKRSSGRDRRSGVVDEKDNRKDRDRDREREKEPAWMDTYIPNDSAAAILGGKGSTDELDGIQAFKKDMKAKEQKDALPSPKESRGADTNRPSGSSMAVVVSSGAAPEKPLDEIQLFRLMMKKEQDQKVPEMLHAPAPEPMVIGPRLFEQENAAPSSTRVRDQRKISTLPNGTYFPLNIRPVTDCLQTCKVILCCQLIPNLPLPWTNLLRCCQKRRLLLLSQQMDTLRTLVLIRPKPYCLFSLPFLTMKLDQCLYSHPTPQLCPLTLPFQSLLAPDFFQSR